MRIGLKPLRGPGMAQRGPQAFTMVELMIVVAITSMVLAGLTRMMTSTFRGVKRGSDLIQTQYLLEMISNTIRTDIRSLRFLDDITPTRLIFRTVMDDEEMTISYEFVNGILTRSDVTNGKRKRLNAAGEIIALEFAARPSKEQFQYLELAFQVRADEKGPDRTVEGSQLAIVSQFYPFCRVNEHIFATP